MMVMLVMTTMASFVEGRMPCLCVLKVHYFFLTVFVSLFIYLFCLFLKYCGLNVGPCARALPLESHSQPFLF
jgi:hypothetical protein